MWRQRTERRLDSAAAAEMSGFLYKTAAGCVDERSPLLEEMQQNKVQDPVFNPRVRLHRLVLPADFQQTVLLKEEAPEEGRSFFPTSSSAVQMEAVSGGDDCGGAETHQNPDLFTDDDSSSLETEASEDDEDGEDANDPDFNLKHLSDSGSEFEESDKDCEEHRAPESGVNAVNKSGIFSESGKQFQTTSHSRIFSSGCVHTKCFRGKKTGSSSKKIQSRHSFNDSGKRYCRKYQLNTPAKLYTGQKPFACDRCGKRFGQKSHLNSHMIIHTGQKPFACDLCGKRFGLKSNLNKHMTIHTGQKPFACDLCGKRFGLKSSLNTHMIIHTGQKPFACDLCGQRFGRKSSLNRHMIIHTRGENSSAVIIKSAPKHT